MGVEKDGRGIWAFDIVKWSVGISLLLFVGLLVVYGYSEEGVRQSIRWSARISFTLFCLAFSASALHYHMKNSLSWWLRMNRKYFGISFAIVHLLHLVFLMLLQYSFHPVFEKAATISLTGGIVAYFFVVTMLLTSFESFSKYISKSVWTIWHTIGGYWIWVVFLTTYYKRTDEPWHWIFVIVLFIILFFRIRALIKKKTARS